MLVAPLMAGGVNADSQTQTTSAPMTQTTGTANANTSTSTTNTTQNNNTSTTNNSNNNQNSSTTGSSNSGQLDAIKAQIQSQYSSMQSTLQQYRQKYQSIPKNQKNQQKALIAQYQKVQKPAEQKLVALQKKYTNTMTPEQRKQAQDQQKAAQKKMMQQIQKEMKAQQKKEQVKMLKTAQTIFVIQGRKVYTLRTDITKDKKGREQLQPIPGINKKYYSSIKAFGRKQSAEIQRARLMAYKARKLRNKSARTKVMNKAQALFVQYARVANMPTEKQQKAEAKKLAKQQKKSQRGRKTNRKVRKRTVRKRNKRNIRKRNKRSRRHVRWSSDKKAKRTYRRRKSQNNRRSWFTVKEGKNRIIYLKSMYRRGNRKALRRSGFSDGVISGNIHTMFNRYKPNNRLARIPRNYRIYRVNTNKGSNQLATVWLVGRHTDNINKINRMRQAYYYRYNNQYGGWANIGYTGK